MLRGSVRNMRKKFYLALLSGVVCLLSNGMISEAKTDSNVIEKGIFIGEMDMSGKTSEEATSEIEGYVDSLLAKEITLVVSEENQVVVTAEELGLTWKNPDIVKEAVSLAKSGNALVRYKALEDLKYENQFFPLELSFDDEQVMSVLSEKCTQYDVEAKDATIHRENGQFVIGESEEGLQLDVEASAKLLTDSLKYGWDESVLSEVELVVEVTEPKAKAEDLQQIHDLLGSYSTSYKTSGASRSANVSNGGSKINGSVLMPGESFSVYETVKPFTEANGYYMAGSYMNGQVVDSIGGGICQVSTTLYNAVLQAELEVTTRYNHSMAVSYVEPSFDAAIAESSGKDFVFVNSTEYPVYIECYSENKVITMNIYGVETRPSNRKVSYQNEIVSVTEPDTEVIYQNAGLPAGYIDVTGAHIGYKAKLWKIVTVDGVEQSREQVNTSNYSMAPRSCVVGVATANPDDYNWLMAAIATGSIDEVRAVANAISARDAAAQAAAQAQQAGDTPQ